MEKNTEVRSDVSCNTIKETSKSRSYLLTINNYEQVDIATLKTWKDITYCVWQIEKGKEETTHIQAAIYFKNARAFNTIKKWFPRAHIESSSCFERIRNYCMKEDSRVEGPWERGIKPEQGRRNDLEKIADDIKNGMKLEEIAEKNPETYIRYNKGLQALKNVYNKDREERPSVCWLWGLSGSGKTRSCYEAHKSVYIKDGTKWWDGYEQQEAIIIDDFDGLWPYRDLLRLLDRYPYQGQIKGGYVKINSPYIYITCEFCPERFWEGNEFTQIRRRIDYEIRVQGWYE